ncbi:MAG: DNRLRE domain-containing protein [Planctomycetes bacterium]|nr:DNRLRE domain-containing protein [Planctomycetota bacterium]
MRFRYPLLALGVALASAASSLASSVTVNPLKDNTLYEDPDGLLSNGAGQYVFTGETRAGTSRRAVLAFDVASVIPAGSTIDSVSLRMHCSRSTTGTRTVELHALLADWGEGTSDAGDPGGGGSGASMGDATWVHRFYPDVPWTSVGGDFSPTISASTGVAGLAFYTWSSTPNMVADVQSWLNNPGQNFGWLLLSQETTVSAKRLDSRENAVVENRPALTINYTIPEPATALLLVVGLAALRRR